MKSRSILSVAAAVMMYCTLLSARHQLFETGQEAEFILGPYQAGSNASGVSYPQRIASDGVRFFVADTRNSRVLIWNSPPVQDNQPADVVVGQPDFESNYSGTGADRMNNPYGVYSDGTRLFVADTYNCRVLIWNQIPTQNGTPADLVLGQPDFDTAVYNHWDKRTPILDPWDVRFDGTRLYVVSTGSQVYIWNTLPTEINQPADVLVGRRDWDAPVHQDPEDWNLVTPRSLAVWDGKLAVSDYQLRRILIWNTIPTQNGQSADVVLLQDDFTTMNDEASMFTLAHGGLWAYEGKLFLASGFDIVVWDEFPTENNQNHDALIPWTQGEAVCYDGRYLTVAQQFVPRILFYDELPTSYYRHEPKPEVRFVLGQRDQFSSEQTGPRGLGHPGGLGATGRDLLAGSCNPPRVSIFKGGPDCDGDEVDLILGMTDWYEVFEWDVPFEAAPMWQVTGIWTDGLRLLCPTLNFGLLMWDRIPDENYVLPTRRLFPDRRSQTYEWGLEYGIEVLGDSLWLLDGANRRILVWNEIPVTGALTDPVAEIPLPATCDPSSMSTDGKRLVIGDLWEGVYIWNDLPTPDDPEPDFLLTGTGDTYIWNTRHVHVSDNHLFVSQSSAHRVLVYENFPTHKEQVYDYVLGQTSKTECFPGMTRQYTMWNGGVHFDGEHLWAGEHKFAHRTLGFRANITPEAPASPTDFIASVLSSHSVRLHWRDRSDNERGFVLRYKRADEEGYSHTFYPVHNLQRCTVNELSANTTYDFLLFAQNSYGTSDSLVFGNVTTLNTEDHPPAVPSDPWPPDGENQKEATNFSFLWEGGDPDPGDRVLYDLYLGMSEDPPLLVENLSSCVYYKYRHGLAADGRYYWKVVARDLSGNVSEGPVWSFHCAGESGASLLVEASDHGNTTPTMGTRWQTRYGLKMVVSAYADEGYVFSTWAGDVPAGQVTDNPLSILLDGEKVIRPVFVSTTGVGEAGVPYTYSLEANYPNPFNPKTVIRYSLKEACHVRLAVYDILGREVRSLISEPMQAGHHRSVWDGLNRSGDPAASGVYLYRLTTKGFTKTKKMILIR